MDAVLRRLQTKLQEKINQVHKPREFFQSKRRWEARELQLDLNSSDIHKQKAAIKRVIANMTLGRDVSALFVDVVKLGQTNNLELKKLVYLYILHNAKLQPDAALLAVNSFLMDSQSQSPLVRALAIRTMMCVRVQGVLEYTVEALTRATKDSDPYVRKTAAIGIGKLFHHNRDMFFSHGFDSILASLIRDSCANVSSNAAAVLMEVRDYSGGNGFDLEQQQMDWLRLMQFSLNEANEWGQVYIMELLSEAKTSNAETAELIVSRALPMLNHSNAAVVLAAIKVIANLANKCPANTMDRVSSRVSTAVLTLSKGDPETQYIVFKNIHMLIVIFPNILRSDLNAFYVRFHDPPYVKIEKLRLLLKLVTPSTSESVVKELQEYCNEVDFAFLEEVVLTTAALAIKIQSVSEQCARLLLRMLHRHRSLLSQVLIASKNILRKYPQLLILNTIIQHHGVRVEEVGDVEAKTALLWMLGEYCDHVKGGRQILLRMAEEVLDLEQPVQLALLTAIVKVFVRDGNEGADMLKTVFEKLTTQSDDPDTRDRAIGYWRLLSSKELSPERLLSILCGALKGQPVNVDSAFSDAMTLKDLKKSVNTAAAVFGRPYQSFLPSYGLQDEIDDDDEEEEEEEEEVPQGSQPGYGASGFVSLDDLSLRRDESTVTGGLGVLTSSSNLERAGYPRESPTVQNDQSPLSTLTAAPVTEEAFLSNWEELGNVPVAQRQLRVGGKMGKADVSNITRWMSNHGLVVAAVVSSLNKIIYMASAPSIDSSSLFQLVIERSHTANGSGSPPAQLIVKGVNAPQLVHVVTMQIEKIEDDPEALEPPKAAGVSLDDLFS